MTKMKFTRENNELVLRLPLQQHKNNCYDEEEEKELTDNLVGCIAGKEYTINHLNDLSYKDSQQLGTPILCFDDEEELREVCKQFDLDVWEYPLCDTCKKPIFGTTTETAEKGRQCFDCVLKEDILKEEGKPHCNDCGSEMINVTDPITKKINKYLWKCEKCKSDYNMSKG